MGAISHLFSLSIPPDAHTRSISKKGRDRTKGKNVIRSRRAREHPFALSKSVLQHVRTNIEVVAGRERLRCRTSGSKSDANDRSIADEH